jgi:hypothetical protein
MGYLIFGFRGTAGDETGGWRAGATYAGGGGDKFEQVERDVLIAAGAIGLGRN